MKQKVLLLAILFTTFLYAQPGTLDTSFNPTDIGFGSGDGADGNIISTALQPDGKILIGGNFTTYNGTSRNRIARLNADGSLDTSFNPGTGANNEIYSIALQSDGKILIGGRFTNYNGTARNRILRLNADGSLDTGFSTGTGANNTVNSIAPQADGKILIGGVFTSYNGTTRNRIARLNTNGSLDTSFSPSTGPNSTVESLVIQSDGKIIIGGWFTNYNNTARNRIARLNADGTLDTSFDPGIGADNTVLSIGLQSDGKIIIGGWFTNYNNTARNRIARLNTNGSLDTSFNPNTGDNNEVKSIALQSDGKILIAVWFTATNPIVNKYIARLNADGSLDTGFNSVGTGAVNRIFSIVTQVDGKIIVGGSFTSYNGATRNFISRLNFDGGLDMGFNPTTGSNNSVTSLALQPDGKILIGGWFTSYNGTAQNYIARLNADSSLDMGFNSGTGANSLVSSIAIQPDGKILIGGGFTSYNGTTRNYIARLNADGSLDAGFNPGTAANNTIRSIAMQPDGKILIGGDFTSYNGTLQNRIARLNADGSLDTSFNPGTGADTTVFSVVLQPDGKILIGGNFTSYNGTTINRIARLNVDGSLETSFNPGTGFNDIINSIVLQPDGKILIGGFFTSYNGTARNYIARLNADGSLDTSFNPGTGANGTIYSLVCQPNGKILIGGWFTSYNGTSCNRIARLNASGSLDTNFNSTGTGANLNILSMLVQPDGRILIGGSFTSYNGTGRNRIARINGGGVNPTVPTLSASNTLICGTSSLNIISGALNDAFYWQWYSNSCGGTLVGTGTSISVSPTVTTTYYARGEGGGITPGSCASITINVNQLPEAPTAVTATAAAICAGASSNLNATSAGNSIRWYNTATGGTIIGTSASGANFAVSPATTTTYYAEAITPGSCTSTTRTPITVTVNPLPAAPDSVTAYPPTICSGATSLSANSSGNSIRWYTVATGGTSFGTSASNEAFVVYLGGTSTFTMTYFADAITPGGCVSATRATVTVTVNPLPEAPTSVAVTDDVICAGETTNLNATSAGNTIRWYTVASGGLNIGTSSSGANFAVSPFTTTTYYAEAFTEAGCASTTRTAVTLRVNPLPATPSIVTASAPSICAGLSSNLTATSEGNIIEWYTSATSGNNIGTSTSGATFAVTPTSTTTYYAGARSVVSAADYCQPRALYMISYGTFGSPWYYWNTGDYIDTVVFNTLNHSLSGDNVYDSQLYPQTTSVVAGSSYSITLTPGPNRAQGFGVWIDYNQNGVFTDAGEFVLSTAPTLTSLGSMITIPAGALNGTTRMRVGCSYNSFMNSSQSCYNANYGEYHDYNITITSGKLGGCVSATRTAVTVTVNPLPAAPTSVTATAATICAGSSSNLNATSAGNTIQWYTVATGGTNIGTSSSGSNFAVSPTTTTTYYAEAMTPSGCVSATRTAVTVTVNPLPAAPTSVTATAATICAGASSNLNATSAGNTIRWYTVATGGTNIGTAVSGANFAVSPTTTTTYYAEAITPSGCVSATRTAVTVTVNQPVTPAFTAVGPICSGASLSALPTTSNNGITGTWSPALNNTTTTTYTFTPTVGQCALNASMTVIVNTCPPTINSFTPTTAATGTTVTLTGTNFTGATAVSFGGTAASSFTVVNATTITAVVGAGTSGSVSVTTPGGTASLAGFVYCVPATPAASIVATPSGSICAGTSVTFTVTPTNIGGGTVNYNFKVGGTSVQSGASNQYTSSALTNGNIVSCDITVSGGTCLTATNATSNSITITVRPSLNSTYANLQHPPTASICQGGTFVSYGQVYKAGLTEAAGPGSGIVAELGFSPVNTNSNPNTWTNWTTAPFNVQVGNNDEYFLTTGSSLPPGTYYYTYRYSLNGCGYQYGGYSATGGGFWNGTTNVSGVLTVRANLTPAATLSASPGTTITSGTAVTFTATASNTGGGTINYNFRVGGVSVQSGASNQFTSSTLANGASVRCDITVTGGSCLTSTTASSNSISMTVSSSATLNLKLFIEGYYNNPGSAMHPVKNNQDNVSPLTDVENLTVQLRSTTAPYNLVATATGMLKTNGNLQVVFPNVVPGSYYIAVKGRNIVQTWSATPQTVGATPLTYDFTTAASKAYGNNMKQVKAGVWAMYSGDLNQDDLIDYADYGEWEARYLAFGYGEETSDMNGDGLVDYGDYSVWEANYLNFVFAAYPY